MTAGHDPGADGGPDERALQSGRAWQHPSEVGLATRGRADRRRTTLIASGVVLGGVGLLLSGVVMGTMQDPASATTSTMPVERAQLSVALVMTTDGDVSTRSTGLVVDDEGHLLVDGGAVDGAEPIRAVCADGELVQAKVIGRDASTDLAVLQLERSTGVPASVATAPPSPGVELRVVRADDTTGPGVTVAAIDETPRGSGQLINLSLSAASRHFPATVTGGDPDPATLRGAMVFDRSGRLAGVVTAQATTSRGDEVQVLAATDAIGVAEALIGQQR